MSGFSYTYRGNDNATNGFGRRTTDWRKTDYDSDHVCRPVIVDAEGRKQPIVSFVPNHNTEAYITQTETIVEHVRAPVTEYRYSEIVPAKDYGYGEEKWRKPLSPVRDHPQHSTHSPFDAYKHRSPTKVAVPVKDYGYGENKWHNRPSSPKKVAVPVKDYGYGENKWHNRPSSPTKVVPVKDYGYGENRWHKKPSSPDREHLKDYGYEENKWPSKQSSPDRKHPKDYGYEENKWPSKQSSPDREHPKDYGYGENKWPSKQSSPDRERPSKVDQFITKVQTAASRPNRFGPLSASHWRRSSPDSNKGHHGNNNGYGDYSDLSSKERYKPSVNPIGNDNYDDYYRRNDSPPVEPKLITTDGWTRPNRTAWATPPNSNLSQPTNDIGAAVGLLKEAARPTSYTTSPQSRFTVPLTTGPTRDSYPDAIDSKEATRRYANLNLTSRPSEPYTGTIDSREAMRKYKGAIV